MKFAIQRQILQPKRRPPRGGRGLKYNINGGSLGTITSPPSRGAWIEILGPVTIIFTFPLSPPSRGAWIEIGWITGTVSGLGESPPSRGAWIEIIS